MTDGKMTRRAMIAAGAALGLAGAARAQDSGAEVDRNASAFRMMDWRDHFDSLARGAIICDIASRALHYWGPDGSHLLVPTSVPRTDELTRRGRTEITRKAENPTWTTTPSQRERYPDWPLQIPGGDPANPLGVRALYLSWPAYLLHGTHDTRKIGRQSSDGCIGMYNHHVTQLYGLVQIGTPVVLL
jgi:lipoprotein-anchoring transpeptidase ErfK/SrfK